MSAQVNDRVKGCFLGLVVGDALGAPFEGMARGSYPEVREMMPGGADIFPLRPGDWTDDTAMALCLAEALFLNPKLDEQVLMNLFGRWLVEGHNACHDTAFGVGRNTRRVIKNYLKNGIYIAEPDDTVPAEGNGSLMRLAPVPCIHFRNIEVLQEVAYLQSRVTHASDMVGKLCQFLGTLCGQLVSGTGWEESISFAIRYNAPLHETVSSRGWVQKNVAAIRAGGHAPAALEAALWVIEHTDNFEDAMIRAVNLGGDTDTVGAIAGQIAGARYGASQIPHHWLSKISKSEQIFDFANRLAEHEPL